MDTSTLKKGQKLLCKKSSGPYNWHAPTKGEIYEYESPSQSLDGAEWINVRQCTGSSANQTFNYYADDFELFDELTDKADFVPGLEYTALRNLENTFSLNKTYKCLSSNGHYVEFEYAPDPYTGKNTTTFRIMRDYASAFFDSNENYITVEEAKFTVAKEWAKALGIDLSDDK